MKNITYRQNINRDANCRVSANKLATESKKNLN